MRQSFLKQLLKYFFVGFLAGLFIFIAVLLYGNLFTLVGFINALTVSTILLFALGWFLLISNVGTLDILYYGVQAFAKAIVGKKIKSSYYDYTANKEQIPKEVLIGFWLASLLHLVVLVILYLIYI